MINTLFATLLEMILKTNKNVLVDYFKQQTLIILTLPDKIDKIDLSMSVGPNIHFKCVEIEDNKVKYIIDYLKLADNNIYLA